MNRESRRTMASLMAEQAIIDGPLNIGWVRG